MFDLPSWRIGRIAGIPVEVNASWLLIFVLVAVSLSFNYFPLVYPDRTFTVDLVSGLVTTLLFFLSVVLHETAHSIVARAGGTGISRITLFAFGGVAQMEEEPGSPGREFIMAIAGPAMSVILAILSFMAFLSLATLGASDVWWAPLEYLAVINVGVAVFNLLPGFPLDGGRVLRAFLWWLTGDLLRATRWATTAGRAIGLLMVGSGLVGALMGQINLVWFAILGWFLTTMAGNAYREQALRSRLAHVTVGQEMSVTPVAVDGSLSVQDLVDRYFLGGRHSRYPVVVDGEVVGILDMGVARDLPRAVWATTRLADLASDDLSHSVTTADTSIDAIIGRLGPEGRGALLVVEGERLVGIISRSDVIRALRRVQAEERRDGGR